jgi:hypothetical protein
MLRTRNSNRLGRLRPGNSAMSSEHREHWFLIAAVLILLLFLLVALWIWLT